MTGATTRTTTRLGDAPPADLLDPAERMSVDELRALQLTTHGGLDALKLTRLLDRRTG